MKSVVSTVRKLKCLKTFPALKNNSCMTPVCCWHSTVDRNSHEQHMNECVVVFLFLMKVLIINMLSFLSAEPYMQCWSCTFPSKGFFSLFSILAVSVKKTQRTEALGTKLWKSCFFLSNICFPLLSWIQQDYLRRCMVFYLDILCFSTFADLHFAGLMLLTGNQKNLFVKCKADNIMKKGLNKMLDSSRTNCTGLKLEVKFTCFSCFPDRSVEYTRDKWKVESVILYGTKSTPIITCYYV